MHTEGRQDGGSAWPRWVLPVSQGRRRDPLESGAGLFGVGLVFGSDADRRAFPDEQIGSDSVLRRPNLATDGVSCSSLAVRVKLPSQVEASNAQNRRVGRRRLRISDIWHSDSE